MTDHVGQQLGNYRIIRPIGRGGFADVYLGEHIYLKTQVAIKLLQMQLSNEEIEGFLQEARTIAHLVHPHIVRVLDFGLEGETPFLVMDYASNGTIRQRYPKGTTMPLSTIASYVKQVSSALQYAHNEKLIHRDIKPENMLLGRNDEILLSDFGIALIAQSSRYQSTQDVVGTIAYMSPEQIQGKPRPASDQYALGVVVYEWLSADRPFHGSFTELCTQHIFATPPPLREKVPTIPPSIEQVVMKALEKDPHRRFESVQVFAIALEQACQLAPSYESVLPIQVPLSSEPALSSGTIEAVSPTQLPRPKNVRTASNQSLQATGYTISSHTSRREAALSGNSQRSRYRLSQYIALWGLVALLILGGGLTWLTLSHPLSGFAVNSVLTNTSPSATTPIATASPNLALFPTATDIPFPTATATPSPTPTPSPTATPSPTPTATPSPTPTATPSPTPTATPVVVIQPTLTTDCGHMVTPWVALYQYSNYGGRQLCFEGTGLINLANYGFDKETMSINIAANGSFYTQSGGQGSQLGFYYGDEKADLGSWDNQISSFIVTS